MTTKHRILALLLALPFFTAPNVSACTIFVLTDTNRALFCNNEDWSNPRSRIWFVPAGDGYLGCAYVGFDNGMAQGGVNTKGLAFDWVAGSKKEWKPAADTKVARGNPSERMLETCATVEEAIAFFRRHREIFFSYAKLLVADQSGNSVIIGVKHGQLNVEKSRECRGFGYGRQTLDKMLETPPEPTVANGAAILRACRQEGKFATKYSNVFDLKSGDMYFFRFPEQPEEVKLNLAAELSKGAHYYDLPQLRQQLTQAPRPLLDNMKRLFMERFHPIRDDEPGTTKRIQAFLQAAFSGEIRAEDCTTEFGKALTEQALATDLNALGGAFGNIESLALAERSAEGDKRSRRYLVECKAATVLMRLVLDQKNKLALVEMEGTQWK